MAITVLEALENALYNFETLGRQHNLPAPLFPVARSQLKNAIRALENGASADDPMPEA